uniref:Reverse transcriptase domain-containing protein n=1 Tax=Angiostrongylus cantonensis TaxID=6313 RepID=A0A0K0D670_ANGCA
MLDDFGKACGITGIRLHLIETLFTMNGLVSYAQFTLNGTKVSEYSSFASTSLEINQMSDSEEKELSGWGSFQKQGRFSKENEEYPTPRPPFRLNDSSCPNVCVRNLVAAKQDGRSLSVIELPVERTMLGVSPVQQLREQIRRSDPRQRSKIKHAVLIHQIVDGKVGQT